MNNGTKKEEESSSSESSSSIDLKIEKEFDAGATKNGQKDTTKTSEDDNEHRIKLLSISKLPLELSPIGEFSVENLAEASKGINTNEVTGNENFDPRFFRNQFAVRQHDPTRRYAPRASPSSEVEFNVIAKRVAEPSDIPCWITVRQLAHLGSGTFSDVYSGTVGNKMCSKSRPAFPVAIKKLWPDRSREDLQISTHRILHHRNIIELLFYYVCVHPTTKKICWTLILEQMPTTILHEHGLFIDHRLKMPEIYTKLFIYQTLNGLAYMERKKILHRDIKPENLLVDMETGRLKIADFGSSKHYQQGTPNSSYQVTRYYRAPELCMNYRFYGPTIDVWAAGCILCELITNRIIFYGRNNNDQLRKIISICGTPTTDQIQKCAPGVTIEPFWVRQRYPPANWYSLLLRYNERVTRVHADFVSKILRYESGERLRGESALSHQYFDQLRNTTRLPNDNPLPNLSF